MEIDKILRMKEGDGEFSYARNSTVQGKVFTQLNKPLIESAIRYLMSNENASPLDILKVADVGCGVGNTPFALISTVTDVTTKISSELTLNHDQVPEIQIYMNDLPSNDFNLLFRELGQLNVPKCKDGMPLSCFIMGCPNSFYKRLFPRNSVHLVHSNYALHWISQVPPSIYNEAGISMNKGSFILSETSPSNVVAAYRGQFRQDFTSFLKFRSLEVVTNGYMILAVLGSPSMIPKQPCTIKLFYQAIANLVSKGLIQEERANSFAMPLHYPAKEEIQSAIIEEGSFAIEKMETRVESISREKKEIEENVKIVANSIWATVEALVSYHFGEQICNALLNELIQVTQQHLEKKPVDLFDIVVMLKKIV